MSRKTKRGSRAQANSSPLAPAPVRPWLVFVLAAVIAAAGAWAYATSVGGAFVFDDYSAIVQNPNIRTLTPLREAMSAPRDTPLAARPFASLTFAINYALAPRDARDVFERGNSRDGVAADRFERNVWGYRAVNIAIHLGAALALFGVIRRTLLTARLRSQFGSAATTLSFAIALLWVVHPLQTEAVTYITQRVESLMGLFALLSLYCAIRASDGTRWLLWTLCAIGSATLAIGSKEVAACIPVLVFAWDWLFLFSTMAAEGRAERTRRRWWLYAGLAAAVALLILIEPGARSRSVGLWLEGWTPWTYLLTESAVLVHYVRLTLWPAPLILDPYWPMVTSFVDGAVPMIVMTLLAAATAVAVVRRHPAGFAGAWFFVILAPTSSVLPIVTEVAADRRMYLPSAAIISLLVLAVYVLGTRLITHVTLGQWSTRMLKSGCAVLLAGVAIGLGSETRARNLDYASDESIWRDTIRKQPANPRGHTALGAILLVQGRYREAEETLNEALRLDPEKAETLSNLGGAEFALGKFDASVTHLERALALRPEYTDAHHNLAEAYVARGQDVLAVPHFRRALADRPNHTVVLNHLGLILAISSDNRVRDGRASLELAERVVRLTGRRDASSLSTLAAALAELDRFSEAVGALDEALALSHNNTALEGQLSRLKASYLAGQKVRRSAR